MPQTDMIVAIVMGTVQELLIKLITQFYSIFKDRFKSELFETDNFHLF